jgi:hypothetical protein
MQLIMATALMMRVVTMAANQKEVNPIWILCDNESTVDKFNNNKILTNIRRSKKIIQLK